MRQKFHPGAKSLLLTLLTSIACLFITHANAKKHFVTGGCEGFKTYTQGGWGAVPHGGNAGTYLHANFAAAFPSGITLGCASGYTLKLTSAQAVTDFIPSGTTPAALTQDLVDPGSSYQNVLAGQLLAATLSVGFDYYDASFGSNSGNLGDLVIASGPFAGSTVNQMLALANDALGGCNTSVNLSDVNDALDDINNNYDNGTSNNGYLNCPSQCNLGVSGTKNDVSCYGAADGSINITVTGAVGPVTYSWNDGATSEDRSGLAPGGYHVTVTNGNCTAEASFTISQPSVLDVSGTPVDVTVVGGSDGSIDVTVTGGTSPYTYLWNDGATTEDRSGLSAGTYTVTVTDAHGCKNYGEFTIHEPTCNLQIGGHKNDVSCNGANDGSIDVTATGGYGTVTYSWNDGATTEDRTGLAPGTYSVTATDAKKCTASTSFEIKQPDALGVSGTPVDVTVVGGSDGSIDVTVTGGTPPYTYLWNDGETTEDRRDLPPGTYSVVVTDAHGCKNNGEFTIHEPECHLEIRGSKNDVSCNGANDGSIDITATGGYGTVSYSWNDGATTEDRAGLAPGNYSVTATDEKHCTAQASFEIKQPDALGVSGTPVDVTVVGGSDGSIDVTVTGGTSPYTYLWNDGATTEDRSGLSAGTYTVTVTDAHGCKNYGEFTIHEPSCNIGITCKTTNVTCYGGNNGSIDITVTGATGNVTYLWNDGATTEDRTGLTAGTYTVTVTDEKGCTATKSITVKQPKKIKVSVVKTGVTSNTSCDATVTLSASGGTAPYTYTWRDGFVGSYRDHLCMGVYYVTVTDKNGCSVCVKIVIPCIHPTAQLSSATSSDISVASDEMDFSASVSPNPTKGIVKLTIKADVSANAVIRVFDINGRAVLSNNINIVKGINYKELNLSSVPKGIYQLQVVAGDDEKVIKIVVE